MKCEQRVRGNKAYLSLFFAVSNVLNGISTWQKIYIIRGNIASATQKLITFEIVWILLCRSSLWKVRYIPETLFNSYQQKALIKLNSPSHAEDLNTPGIVPYFGMCFWWIQPTKELFGSKWNHGLRNVRQKWCNGLLRPYDTAGRGGDGRTWVPIYLLT